MYIKLMYAPETYLNQLYSYHFYTIACRRSDTIFFFVRLPSKQKYSLYVYILNTTTAQQNVDRGLYFVGMAGAGETILNWCTRTIVLSGIRKLELLI